MGQICVLTGNDWSFVKYFLAFFSYKSSPLVNSKVVEMLEKNFEDRKARPKNKVLIFKKCLVLSCYIWVNQLLGEIILMFTNCAESISYSRKLIWNKASISR